MSTTTPVKKPELLEKRRGTLKFKHFQTERVERINIVNYEFHQMLSKINNGTGILKLVKNIETNQYYCMKILKKIDIMESKVAERLYNEYQLMRRIYHPFIIQLKGINNKDNKYLYEMFEFVQGGEFSYRLSQGLFSEAQAIFYSAIALTVMDYLHRQNIIMRNISPDNILFTSDGYIKFINFIDSKHLKNEYTNTLCGDPEYNSPEMIMRKGHTKSHDIWTLGIFIYHMLLGHTPFEDIDPTKVQQKILDGKVKYPKCLSHEAKNLIKHLLKIEPKKRIGCGQKGIVEIIYDPFFKGFDWTNLLLQNLKAPYIPDITDANKNFSKYVDDFFDEYDNELIINTNKDPFQKWD